ncbi:unnamed protein product [Phytophthora lilii]|uniref:Unnamed protein product n=1 Tax=Phytophthora lilii TaxID=2077276 RepID=A0A9W7DAL6_9STRA|nr:unnamed protein product [Phytophthora lilii]
MHRLNCEKSDQANAQSSTVTFPPQLIQMRAFALNEAHLPPNSPISPISKNCGIELILVMDHTVVSTRCSYRYCRISMWPSAAAERKGSKYQFTPFFMSRLSRSSRCSINVTHGRRAPECFIPTQSKSILTDSGADKPGA